MAAKTDKLSVVTTNVLLLGIVVELIWPDTLAFVKVRVFVLGL